MTENTTVNRKLVIVILAELNAVQTGTATASVKIFSVGKIVSGGRFCQEGRFESN